MSHKNDEGVTSLDCPIFSVHDIKIFDDVRYWVGGVGVCLVSLIGLVLNSLSIFAISRNLWKHNIFNHLILILFIVDSMFLFLETTHAIHARQKYDKIAYQTFPLLGLMIYIFRLLFCRVMYNHRVFYELLYTFVCYYVAKVNYFMFP